MTYRALMAHLGVNQSNSELLRVATSLSGSLKARVVGVAACQPMQFADHDGYSGGQAMIACRDELERELRVAEGEFHLAMKDVAVPSAWRSSHTLEALPHYLADEARCADLIITSAAMANPFDAYRHASVGDLVMRAGRPVLAVPLSGARVPFDRVVIAWKDKPEARRAAFDALPLLAMAKHVTVLEVADKADVSAALKRIEDVVDWLGSHGISAEPLAVPSFGDEAMQLDAMLAELRCDLVVAGAYGHGRLREWVFGGVTRDLLQGQRCALLSH